MDIRICGLAAQLGKIYIGSAQFELDLIQVQTSVVMKICLSYCRWRDKQTVASLLFRPTDMMIAVRIYGCEKFDEFYRYWPFFRCSNVNSLHWIVPYRLVICATKSLGCILPLYKICIIKSFVYLMQKTDFPRIVKTIVVEDIVSEIRTDQLFNLFLLLVASSVLGVLFLNPWFIELIQENLIVCGWTMSM